MWDVGRGTSGNWRTKVRCGRCRLPPTHRPFRIGRWCRPLTPRRQAWPGGVSTLTRSHPPSVGCCYQHSGKEPSPRLTPVRHAVLTICAADSQQRQCSTVQHWLIGCEGDLAERTGSQLNRKEVPCHPSGEAKPLAACRNLQMARRAGELVLVSMARRHDGFRGPQRAGPDNRQPPDRSSVLETTIVLETCIFLLLFFFCHPHLLLLLIVSKAPS